MKQEKGTKEYMCIGMGVCVCVCLSDVWVAILSRMVGKDLI